MQIKIDTDAMIITLCEKCNLGELFNELDKIGIELDNWEIEIEPKVILQKEFITYPSTIPPWTVDPWKYTDIYYQL